MPAGQKSYPSDSGLKSPAKRPPKIFYGWYIAGVAMLATSLATSTSQLFMGVVVKPITEDLGWSRTAASGAVTLGTLGSGLISPIAGRLTDRHGARPLMTIGGLIVAAALVALSSMSELWQFYVVYVVGRSISAATLATVVPSTAITNWFRRMRGRVLGFHVMALGLGGSFVVFVGQLLIDAHGWRSTFFVFALLILTLVVPSAALVLLRRPEDIGLLPDGDTVGARGTARGEGVRGWGLGDAETGMGERAKGGKGEAETGAARPVRGRSDEFSWTIGEAVRTRSLWFVTAGISMAVLGTGGVAFELVPYFTDLGISATLAALAVSLYALAGALASALWGFASERFSERYLAVFAMSLGAVVVVALFFVTGPVSAIACAIVFGVASRGEAALLNLIVAQYFGRHSYGTINGFIMPFQQAGLGLGPLVASLFFDVSGSYHAGFVFFAAAYVVSAVLFWLARRPALPARAYGGSATLS